MAKKNKKQTQETPDVESSVDSNSPGAELSEGELESVTGGASDYLLKIDGIKGEVSDSNHKNEIDVLSYSWGVSQTGIMGLKK